MNFVIAIPTYKRYDIKTLEYIKREQIPAELITIFVADETEYDLYFAKWGPEFKIVIGVLGIGPQRNFITQYYEEGTYVVSMDDDIRDLISLEGVGFSTWIQECLAYMQLKKVGLLGISPISNLYWMQERKGERLKCGRYLCVGVFQIYQVRKEYKLTVNYIEDYERSILYLKHDGAVGRYEGICIKTTFWTKGGCTASGRNAEEYCNQVNKLVSMYPDELHITMKRITQLSKTELMPNIRIIRLKPNIGL
jgi:hypothetical protein